jgi:hypothetical protein
MTELNNLLDRASELDHPPTSVDDDLARGRAALRRRRARGAIRIGSIAAVGVIAAGIVGSSALEREPDNHAATPDQGADGVQLVAADADAGPYTFGKLPEGWEVQGVLPSAVTIAPAGFKDQSPYSFLGKLVIMYDQYAPSGDLTTVNGRDFFSRGDSDHTTVMVTTRPGEPNGTVYVQYPDSTGWDEATMIEFLDAVRVNESAQPGVG